MSVLARGDHECVGAVVRAESATVFSGLVWNKGGVNRHILGTQTSPMMLLIQRGDLDEPDMISMVWGVPRGTVV